MEPYSEEKKINLKEVSEIFARITKEAVNIRGQKERENHCKLSSETKMVMKKYIYIRFYILT